MSIDISFLPALAVTMLLVFARVGTLIMLLPGVGEVSVPVQLRLTVAWLLAMVLLPLHRSAYQIDLGSFGPVFTLLFEEMLVGAVLGISARLTISALEVSGSVIASALGLGFVTAVDPTQGQQGAIVGNFLTMLGVTLIFTSNLHYLVIGALDDSYTLFRPGEIPLTGDMAALVTHSVTGSFRIGVQLAAPFLVFGFVFNLALGLVARMMPQMQVFFVGVPLSIMIGLIILMLVLGAMMMTYLAYVEDVLHQIAPHI
jgi:flagellar biosynthesis protein FliR